MGAVGLQTYIWNNRLKSILLLAGFPFLLFLICFAFALIISATTNPSVEQGIEDAIALTPSLVPVAIGGALVWFVIAWFANQKIVDLATRAHRVNRADEPRLWNLLENLCISRGITMPSLRIIETDARNAFASGIRQKQYAITVTRGLMDSLTDAELEDVLAHELTHIRNRDVQLLVVAAVFAGVISLVGDMLIRSPRALLYASSGRRRSRSSSSSSGKGGGGAVVLILIAVAIFLIARLLAVVLTLALSRRREFLADAGAVELTKNPDAMISALRKIEGHSELQAPTQIRAMFIDVPRKAGFAAWFASHPPIEKRIEALVEYAAGQDMPVSLAVAEPAEQIAEAAAEPAMAPEQRRGPFDSLPGPRFPAGPWS